ncbi:hypothetical protein F5Y00DRAFT_80191 [Daldinia vernicosa]|uniref:uncharacterized protein n=1 Tax=Daldinia vernicosa TaxID=114800 RepID=UPI002008CAC2|nr:uncharacterized protein F5Y00DRAFT_80191 [Daldinia vernicosa]KAI0848696.1 hypothetical protein F5Y00DRAFT_80191 [Daldinia vernicosa]
MHMRIRCEARFCQSRTWPQINSVSEQSIRSRGPYWSVKGRTMSSSSLPCSSRGSKLTYLGIFCEAGARFLQETDGSNRVSTYNAHCRLAGQVFRPRRIHAAVRESISLTAEKQKRTRLTQDREP